MDYSEFVDRIAGIFVVQINDNSSATPSSDDNFNIQLPQAIGYAENRIQRDLDLMGTVVAEAGGTLQKNEREQTLPVPNNTQPFVVVQSIALYIGGALQPPLNPASRDFMDFTWPMKQSLGATVYPKDWCRANDLQIIVGPAPAENMSYQAVGTIRLVQISATNVTNALTDYFPSLYVAAAAIYLAGYQRDFGAQSEDPQMAQSWENQYKTLLASAVVEEARKRYANNVQSSTNAAGAPA